MEKSISNSIIRSINQMPGCLAYKRLSSGSSSTNGFPDITGLIGITLQIGLVLAIRLEIEVKQPGKVPTRLQISRLRHFQALGCVAIWTDSQSDCMAKLRAWIDYLEGRAASPPDLIGPGLKKPVLMPDFISAA